MIVNEGSNKIIGIIFQGIHVPFKRHVCISNLFCLEKDFQNRNDQSKREDTEKSRENIANDIQYYIFLIRANKSFYEFNEL